MLISAVHVLCVIPARVASTRLAQKPLRLIAGEPLIRHVARRVLDFDLGFPVVVATDDLRVDAALSGLEVGALLTGAELSSGTERTAAVLAHPAYRHYDVILNVQGDEPLVERQAVVGALERVRALGDEIGTAAARLGPGKLTDPNRVKVVVNGRGRAVAFFRSPHGAACPRRGAIFQHVGVYAYQASALRRWVGLPRTAQEESERLEQLRPLAHGMRIGVAVQDTAAAPAVDTEADIREVEGRLMVPSWE